MTPDPIRAHYRLHPTGGGAAARSSASVSERARAIAREQTLEVPTGAASPGIEARFLGRVMDVVPDAEGPPGRARVVIEYAPALFDGSLTQLLNLAWGNVSLMDGVVLADLELPAWLLDGFGGPRLGIPGIRRLVGDVRDRPLVSSALKPVGLDVAALAALAGSLARGGVDIIKDDHGLADQEMAPFRARVGAVQDAVEEANARTGGHTAYFPHVTAPAEELSARVALAREAGCGGVVLCPGLTGMDTMRALAARDTGLAVMAHPSHANTSPNATRGIAPDLLLGTLWRLAGADAVIYVNAKGRFAWPLEACLAVNRRAREALGSHLPAFPVPAGGIQAADVRHWFRQYGPDTLLLIGGSLLESPDVEAAAREVVEAAREAGETARGARGAAETARGGGEAARGARGGARGAEEPPGKAEMTLPEAGTTTADGSR